MLINERELKIARPEPARGIIRQLAEGIARGTRDGDIPIRFVVTRSDDETYHCEIGTISPGGEARPLPPVPSIFDYRPRDSENTDQFNAVLLIPTGIGAALGGHSGDGGALARLMGSVCDNLVTHPNVVNAADINELPDNGLYVEGSVITRLLMGTAALQRVRSNRVMLVIDQHDEPMFHELAINSASAARAALGLDCPLVVKMENRSLMRALFSRSGRAVGQIEYFEDLCDVLEQHRPEYDALALSTLIQIPEHFHADYFREENRDMVNPWGGVEAMLTHAISLLYNVPSAHSPMMTSKEVMNLEVGVVDPRKAAEVVSTTYLHCVLKGLHRSPHIISDPDTMDRPGVLTARDVSCLVIPDGCLGLPTFAALEQGIPVIAVRENRNRMQNDLRHLPFTRGKLFIVDNYLEAVGVMQALKAGVCAETVRRPLGQTHVQPVRGGRRASIPFEL